ncbi:prepilin-type N-terminal cleavage/methylation domain-containing protein [Desulfospira joergensenii]|uniref:prepilin-type N-terminal cleavage/methylation domain-containing protein n=1 Tax=Desulfospira joergensenii TaxID=53329 RepID=UPI0004205DF1|nr:prepilin-type N-terminal cleavage/methylation domain-containing protein [Desulfospira joergensenii]
MNLLKDNQGFTLIEALMAMLVLTIGILALNSMQVSSTRGNSSANNLTVASSVAGDGFERLLNLDYDDSTMDPAGNPHDETELTGYQLPAGVASISWNVAEWTNTDGTDNDGDGTTDEADELNIKLVSLTVNYQDQQAKTLTINFLKSELY